MTGLGAGRRPGIVPAAGVSTDVDEYERESL